MEEITYPEGLEHEELYKSVSSVLNDRGYKDRNGESEALYDAGDVTVEIGDDVLEISGPSEGEEKLLANLLDPEIQKN